MNWHRPIWYVWDHWSESRIELRIEDMPDGPYRPRGLTQWLAANWGIDLNSPDLEREVDSEWQRRRPCVDCGQVTPARTNRYRCDPCFLRDVTRRLRVRELERRRDEFQREQRQAAAAAIARLSPARRRLIEQSGLRFTSPAQVMAEAHGEW